PPPGSVATFCPVAVTRGLGSPSASSAREPACSQRGGKVSQVDELADQLRGLSGCPERDEPSDDFAQGRPILVAVRNARVQNTAVVEDEEIRVVGEEDPTLTVGMGKLDWVGGSEKAGIRRRRHVDAT